LAHDILTFVYAELFHVLEALKETIILDVTCREILGK
jgi:hypothetical protein